MKLRIRNHCTGKVPANRSLTRSASLPSEWSAQTAYLVAGRWMCSLSLLGSSSFASHNSAFFVALHCCYSSCHSAISEFSGPLKLAFSKSRPGLTETDYEHGACQLLRFHSCHACYTWFLKRSAIDPSQLSCFAGGTCSRPGSHSATAYPLSDPASRPDHLVCASATSPALQTCHVIPVARWRSLTVRRARQVSWQSE